MRLRVGAIDAYAADLAVLLERYGATLQPSLASGAIGVPDAKGVRLIVKHAGSLPGERRGGPVTVEVRETFGERGAGWLERVGYSYELIDRIRDFRIALHMHHREWFEDRYLVVVHEHCERPIGVARCAHYAGSPIRDGFAGIAILMAAWIGDPPDCASRPCLE